MTVGSPLEPILARQPGGLRVVTAVATILLAVVALIIYLGRGGEASVRTTTAHISVAPMEAFHPPIRTLVSSGDTIESVSRRLAGDDWVEWRDALVGEIDPKKLFPGTEFRGVCSPAGHLERLEVVFDRRTEVHLMAVAEGIEVERVERPIESEVVRFEGIVESSLFGAMETAGGGPELAVRMAEMESNLPK